MPTDRQELLDARRRFFEALRDDDEIAAWDALAELSATANAVEVNGALGAWVRALVGRGERRTQAD